MASPTGLAGITVKANADAERISSEEDRVDQTPQLPHGIPINSRILLLSHSLQSEYTPGARAAKCYRPLQWTRACVQARLGGRNWGQTLLKLNFALHITCCDLVLFHGL